MNDFSFSLNEIKNELENLGYKNVPVDKILEFKADLELLVRDDESMRESLLGDSSLTSQDNKESVLSVYEDDQSSVMTGDSGRRMKRKTLRKRNGKVSVEETYTTDGSIISTPAPSTNSKANSCYERRSHSVSSNSCTDAPYFSAVIKSVSYESSNKLSNRSDPVGRYHEYQRFWRGMTFPGKKEHKSLRWNVRGRVGQYDAVVNKNKLLPVDFIRKPVYKNVVDTEWNFV